MIRLVSYCIYILVLGILLALWYSNKAYIGFFMPMFFIVATFIVGLIVGELIRPQDWIEKRFIIIAGCSAASIILLLGHYKGYQKTVQEVARYEFLDLSLNDNPINLTEEELFISYTEELIGEQSLRRFEAYHKYLAHVGFIEYPKIQPNGSKGFWVYMSWLFQIIMLGFGVYAAHYAIDPQDEARRTQAKAKLVKQDKKEPAKSMAKNGPKKEEKFEIKDPLLDGLKNYLRDSKTDWKNVDGSIVTKSEIMAANSFQEITAKGFTARSKDEQGRAFLNCLLHDRRSMNLALHLIEDDKNELQDQYLEEYEAYLREFAQSYGEVKSWGFHPFFDERYPPSYTSNELKKLELKAVELIQKGADINDIDERNVTIFMLFSKVPCSIKMYSWLFKQGADVNTEDKQKQTPLFYAVLRNDQQVFETTKMLIDSGANVLHRDQYKKTVFNHVASSGKVGLFWSLFEHVPDDKKVDILNECIKDATRSTNAKFLKEITKMERELSGKEAYVDSDHGHSLWSRDINNALWVRDNDHLLDIILEGGLFHLASAGEVIRTAVAYNNVSGLKILLEQGAKVDSFENGYTPYMQLGFFNKLNYPKEILILLESLKIPINAIDDRDCTALDYLTGVNNNSRLHDSQSRQEYAEYLVKHGNDPHRISMIDGLTPIERARSKNLDSLVEMLERLS